MRFETAAYKRGVFLLYYPCPVKLFQVSWNEALELMVTTPVLELKAELLGARDAIRVAKWDMAHPVEAAERRRFVEGVLVMSK